MLKPSNELFTSAAVLGGDGERKRVTSGMKCFNVHCAEGFLYTPRENDVYPRETYTRERPRMEGLGVVAEPPDANTSSCRVPGERFTLDIFQTD